MINAKRACFSTNIYQSTHFHANESAGNDSKTRNFVRYDMTLRDVKCRSFACEQVMQQKKGRGFSFHRSGDEGGVDFCNSKKTKSWEFLGHSSTSSARPNIHTAKALLGIWWTGTGIFIMNC